MSDAPSLDRPHRRHDPLRDAWVLVSAGRASRPWRGRLEPATASPAPSFDPTCELCPGNPRATGIRNPAYAGPFVFENDFPALGPAPVGAAPPDPGSGPGPTAASSVLRAEDVSGVARVVCFSPRHDASLASLSAGERRSVVDAWAEQSRDLGQGHRWVQVFENRGEAMGASNPHPHGQVWASTSLPTEAAREDASQRRHLERTGRALLDDIREAEATGPRVVVAAGPWLAIVPYWAAWPFEALIVGPASAKWLDDLDDAGRTALVDLLGDLLGRYDELFGRPFPYSMGWHQAPFGTDDIEHWRLHAHVYPPLLRADARKFMVGYELLAEPQRDLSPEEAAIRIRAVRPTR